MTQHTHTHTHTNAPANVLSIQTNLLWAFGYCLLSSTAQTNNGVVRVGEDGSCLIGVSGLAVDDVGLSSYQSDWDGQYSTSELPCQIGDMHVIWSTKTCTKLRPVLLETRSISSTRLSEV